MAAKTNKSEIQIWTGAPANSMEVVGLSPRFGPGLRLWLQRFSPQPSHQFGRMDDSGLIKVKCSCLTFLVVQCTQTKTFLPPFEHGMWRAAESDCGTAIVSRQHSGRREKKNRWNSQTDTFSSFRLAVLLYKPGRTQKSIRGVIVFSYY